MRRKCLFLVTLILCGCASPPPPSPRSPELVFQALATAGVPYRRGGDSRENGFDCSGLVAHVYREAWGIQLPHNALAQSRVGKRITVSGLEAGERIVVNGLQRVRPGALVEPQPADTAAARSAPAS